MSRTLYRNLCLSAGCLVLMRWSLVSQRPKPAGAQTKHPVASKAPSKTATAAASDKMAKLPEEFLAFDVSRPFGDRRARFKPEVWKRFCQDALATGRHMVVVQARGSVSSSPYADLLLSGARAQGLRTAAYVFLNFNRTSPSGDIQMKRALQAVGSEAKHLDFMVVDVENGAAGNLSQAERVNRIGQAVEGATRAQLRPVIYAKNTGGRHGEWTDLTGNARDFAYLPLWVPRYDCRPTLDADGYSANDWKGFGGWSERHGKQFADDRLTVAPAGIAADESVFHRSVLEGPVKPKPYRVTPLVQVAIGKATRDEKTGEVIQPVKLVNKSGSSISGPISLVLDNLSSNSPLSNPTGKATEKTPYVRLDSQTLPPGGSVRTELRFEKTSSAPPVYQPEVLAGNGDL